MTTDISDLYFNYDKEKKDNIKYYAFAISRENTDSIMIKYVLCSDSNVEEKIASYQKGMSEISWNGFHVKEESQSIEKCTENCTNLDQMFDPAKKKVPNSDTFYFVLYKVSQTGTKYEKTFLKMLFGQLTNDYKIIDYEISDVDVEENNVPDEIERWKKKIAGDRAIQKALATAIKKAKQMKREIYLMKLDSEAERRKKEERANEKAEQEILHTVSKSIINKHQEAKNKLNKLLESRRSIKQQKMKYKLDEREKKKDNNPLRRKSETINSSTSIGSLSNIHHSQSSSDVLNVPQHSDPESGSGSDSEFSGIYNLRPLKDIEQSSSSTGEFSGNEDNSSVITGISYDSDDSSIVPNPNGEPDEFSTLVKPPHSGKNVDSY